MVDQLCDNELVYHLMQSGPGGVIATVVVASDGRLLAVGWPGIDRCIIVERRFDGSYILHELVNSINDSEIQKSLKWIEICNSKSIFTDVISLSSAFSLMMEITS